MKMIPAASSLMNLFVLVFALELPAHVAGGGLRGLGAQHPSMLQPLQQPPPATADLAVVQLQAQVMKGNGAAGPAPAAPEFTIPAVTEATCEELKGKVATEVDPEGAAVLLEERQVTSAGAPTPAGEPGNEKVNVDCKIYAWVSKEPAGCMCFIEAPPPPSAAPKVAGCPKVPDAIKMGFTGDVLPLGPMAFGGQTGGWTRHTCIYRQWFFDPKLTGKQLNYQIGLNNKRTEKYIRENYAAALGNAHGTAAAFWPLTPVPWLQLYPTTPWPGMEGHPGMAPGPGPAPAPGPMGPTTPQVHTLPPTEPPTPPPFALFGGFGGVTTTGAAFGPPVAPMTPPPGAPQYVAVR